MGKGSATRQQIVKEALQLFSVKGYFNTSIHDLLSATGITKGGLYGHFKSKEDVWYAVYDEAVRIWRKIVFKGIREIRDPLERIQKTVEQDMQDYLGSDTFEGGCFFLNSLVELSGQSSAMASHILKGFVAFSRLIRSWLQEAESMGILRWGIDHKETASFIVIALNGAAALYGSSRDAAIWQQTIHQIGAYVDQLREPGQPKNCNEP
ncbi:MAG: TetR/AcrR family transcriptional regulator [Desulfobacteraceae bacterium]|nr:MAG: TetR/AcrR family transcriptional regulator [Desulfobacteraceae bacterium]